MSITRFIPNVTLAVALARRLGVVALLGIACAIALPARAQTPLTSVQRLEGNAEGASNERSTLACKRKEAESSSGHR